MHGGQRPCHVGDPVGERQGFGCTAAGSAAWFDVDQAARDASRATFSMTAAGSTPTTELAPAAQAAPGRDAGPTPDVDDSVAGADAGQPHGELGLGVAADVEAQRSDEATEAAEPRVVGMVVGRECHIGGAKGGHVEYLDT